MKLDAGEIKSLVTETEKKRHDWAYWADRDEELWRLVDFHDTDKDHKDLDGVRAVVMPDPFNVVQLTQRMVADEPRVEIPSLSVKEDDEDRSEIIEEWLVAFDFESNRLQGKNHSNDKTWQSAVLGRGASRTIWTGDILPQGLQSRLPILRENIDPRNAAVSRTYFGKEWGYHKYPSTRAYIERHYPKFKLPEPPKNTIVQGYWNEKYTIIDFWCWHQGAVWNCVVIDGAGLGANPFGKKPSKTDYPDIPIEEWYADGAPVKDEAGRSVGIIHPIRGTYKAKNDFISRMLTGMEYYYDPTLVAKLKPSAPKFKAGPGEIIYLETDESVDVLRADPNYNMGQAVLAILQTGMDQATYPGVTYGDAPGGVNAGFALNNLAQQAQARAKLIRSNIEGAYEAEFQLVLGLIEAMAPDEGVEIYGRSARGDRGRPLKLTKKIIKGNYANRVMLTPEQPMDDNARIMAWLQMVDKGIVSKATMRNRIINVAMPRDEDVRIATEQAEMSQEMSLKKQLRALQKSRTQDDWELLIVGTPLEPVHQQEEQWREQKRAEAEQAKAQRQEERRLKEMQEMMANMPPLPPMMPSPGMPDPMMMPPTTGPLPPMGGMPPGMPGDMQPPGLPGVPPQAAGQMTPDMLGVPPGAPPGTFDQLMGGAPPSDEELMRQMGALPPQF